MAGRPTGWSGQRERHSAAARAGWNTRNRNKSMREYDLTADEADFFAWYRGGYPNKVLKPAKAKSPSRVAAGQKAAQTRYGHAGRAPALPEASKHGGGVSRRGLGSARRSAEAQIRPTHPAPDATAEVLRAADRKPPIRRKAGTYPKGGGDATFQALDELGGSSRSRRLHEAGAAAGKANRSITTPMRPMTAPGKGGGQQKTQRAQAGYAVDKGLRAAARGNASGRRGKKKEVPDGQMTTDELEQYLGIGKYRK